MTRLSIALFVLVATLAPCHAAAAPSEAADPLADVVAEAAFLSDALPPGGNELGLVVSGEAEEGGGMGLLMLTQLNLRLTQRIGLAAGIAVDPSSGVRRSKPYSSGLHSPAGSLRVLLRSPEGGALGVATCLDVVGPGPGQGAEVGIGLGLVRALGGLTFRAGASVATPVAGGGPRVHAGASAAVALGESWRLLGEAIVETEGGAVALWAGPTAKVSLSEEAALAASALFDLQAPSAPATYVLQLAVGI